MSGFVEFGVIPLVGALVFYFAMKWVIEYDPFYTGRPDLTRKEKRYYREQEEQIKLQELAVSIQQLESELLSVDFYTWLDALALVIDYQITGNTPRYWRSFEYVNHLDALELVEQMIRFLDHNNHTIQLAKQSFYFIPSNYGAPYCCSCGADFGWNDPQGSELFRRFKDHQAEISSFREVI